MTLKKALSTYDQSLEKSKQTYSGKLGLTIGGARTVEHPTRNGFVYVRIGDNISEAILAFNDKVSPVYDLPVLIQRSGNRWVLVGRDSERYSDWGTSAPFLPKHGDQHSFNREGGGGGDTVSVFPDQFMPLLVYPSGTVGAGNMLVAPYILQKSSNFIYVGNTGTPSVLIYKPTNSQAIMGLVYLDKDTGNPGILIASGTPFAGTITGTNAIVPYLPYPSSTQEPLYAFRLVSGTVSITWDNLYNVRQFVGGSTSTGSSGIGPLTADRVVITDLSGNVTTDSDLQWDNTAQQIKIGDPSTNFVAVNGINQVGPDSAALTNFLQSYNTGTTFGPRIAGVRGRGTNLAHAGVLNGDVGLRLVSFYVDSSGTVESTSSTDIFSVVEEEHTPLGHGASLEYYVTPTGTTSKIKAFKVQSDGNVAILTGTYNVGGRPHTHLFTDGMPGIINNVALTGQTTSITGTFSGANIPGTYRVNFYLEVPTADATAGTISLNITWTDDAGNVIHSTAALPLTVVGRVTPNPIFIRLASGGIAYSTSLVGIIGTSNYRVYMTCERLT